MGSASLALPVAYVLCGALPLGLVPYVRGHSDKPGSTGLLITISGLACWAFAASVLFVATSYGVELVAASALILGAQLAGIGYFLIATEYVDWIEPTRRTLAALAVLVVGFQLVVLTEPLHQLVWAGYGPGHGADGRYGPLFAVHQAIGFGFAGVGLVVLGAEALSTRGVRRRQSTALVLSGTPPVVMAAIGSFLLVDVEFALSPFAFALSAFLYAWALFGVDFLQIVPVGRRWIVEEMDDAAVTLDPEGRVVDANDAARRLSDVADGTGSEGEPDGTGNDGGPDGAEISRGPDGAVSEDGVDESGSGVGARPPDTVDVGVPVEEFFGSIADAVGECDDVEELDDREIAVLDDGRERHFHLKTSRIGDERTRGRLVVLRDITELKRRERALEERERQLDLLRQVLARVLRHNIRNDLTVVRGYAREIETAAEAGRGAATADRDGGSSVDAGGTSAAVDPGELAGSIVEKCDELVDLSNKAATIERLVTRSQRSRRVDLAEALAETVERFREAYPSVDLRFEAPQSCTVETAVPVEFALENLIENAIEHSDGQAVSVSVATTDGRGTVTVDDDGPGIPAHELEVLERGEETPLQHGSGLGLWIVYWIVEHSDCSVTFSTGADGTTITFGVPLAEPV